MRDLVSCLLFRDGEMRTLYTKDGSGDTKDWISIEKVGPPRQSSKVIHLAFQADVVVRCLAQEQNQLLSIEQLFRCCLRDMSLDLFISSARAEV